jgi:hypothetical protein
MSHLPAARTSGPSEDQSDESQAPHLSPAFPSSPSTPAAPVIHHQVCYPPGFPFVPPPTSIPGDGPTYYYIPFPVMPAQPPGSSNQDGQSSTYPQHAVYMNPYHNGYVPAPAYLMHPSQRGADGQLGMHIGYGPVYTAHLQGADSGRGLGGKDNEDSGGK